jgi:hypothetical protein
MGQQERLALTSSDKQQTHCTSGTKQSCFGCRHATMYRLCFPLPSLQILVRKPSCSTRLVEDASSSFRKGPLKLSAMCLKFWGKHKGRSTQRLVQTTPKKQKHLSRRQTIGAQGQTFSSAASAVELPSSAMRM